MSDKFKDRNSGLESPGFNAEAVTPNDATDLATTSRALYIGAEGDLRLTMAGGNTVTFASVPMGILPVRAARVHATGTTAANIVALW